MPYQSDTPIKKGEKSKLNNINFVLQLQRVIYYACYEICFEQKCITLDAIDTVKLYCVRPRISLSVSCTHRTVAVSATSHYNYHF